MIRSTSAVQSPNMNRNRLAEIDFIRPIIILLLIVYHAFIIYAGGWNPPTGFQPNIVYEWIAKTSYSFMLEAFVFISGYIFMYQIKVRNKFDSLGGVIFNKIKRLIVPSVIFSILYLILFKRTEFRTPFVIYRILEGVGHMWFLPMLFWCFIGGWLMIKSSIDLRILWVVSLVFAGVSYLPLPFRMGNALYYLPFFAGGGLVYEYLSERVKRSVTICKIVEIWIVFAFLFVVISLFNERNLGNNVINDVSPLYLKAFYRSAMVVGKMLYAFSGVAAVYATACFYSRNHKPDVHVLEFGKYCFGIYLFQQFILQILYYKTSAPVIMGPIGLPWFGCVITLIMSYFLTCILFRTRVGRFLIG